MNKLTFRKTDLSWIVDYDYDRSNCTCGDWPCRCTTIENTRIDNINVHEVVEALYNKHSRDVSDIDKYCFDRICYAFRVYDEYLYEVETCGGYYGEEVCGVWFENEEEIVKAYQELVTLETDVEKVKYCLKLEYGYVLDCITAAEHSNIAHVVPGLVKLPQREYHKKVSMEVINAYKDRKLPVAVCVKDGGSYRLIDGYHRFVANKNRNSVSIVVLE